MEFITSFQVSRHKGLEVEICFAVAMWEGKVLNFYCFPFAVQAEVIPAILESVSHGLLIGRGGYKPRDICVSAPTGSGKTLAFVIPVIQV